MRQVRQRLGPAPVWALFDLLHGPAATCATSAVRFDQEIHAPLIVYQLLRTAMLDATDSRPGLDPDRASFTTALTTARNQLIQATGIITDTVHRPRRHHRPGGPEPPAPRPPDPRQSPHDQTVEHQVPGPRPNIDRRTYQATIAINIITNER